MDANQHTNLEAVIAELGLRLHAEFEPKSRSRNKSAPKPSLNWAVTVSHQRGTLECNYMQGIGHLPGYDSIRRDMDYASSLQTSSETGMWNMKKIEPPKLVDVLYSLISDAEAASYSSFEDWAQCFGFDSDSIKAEKIYKDCLATYVKLRAMLGDENLKALTEAFQDY